MAMDSRPICDALFDLAQATNGLAELEVIGEQLRRIADLLEGRMREPRLIDDNYLHAYDVDTFGEVTFYDDPQAERGDLAVHLSLSERVLVRLTGPSRWDRDCLAWIAPCERLRVQA